MFVLVFVTYLLTLIVVALAAASFTTGVGTLFIVVAAALFGGLAVAGIARHANTESPKYEDAEADTHSVPPTHTVTRSAP